MLTEEQAAAELAEYERRQSRNSGLEKAKERDAGFARLSNGTTIRWNAPPHKTTLQCDDVTVEVTEPIVPVGTLILDGKVYDVEELRSYLRWA